MLFSKRTRSMPAITTRTDLASRLIKGWESCARDVPVIKDAVEDLGDYERAPRFCAIGVFVGRTPPAGLGRDYIEGPPVGSVCDPKTGSFKALVPKPTRRWPGRKRD